MFTKIRDPLFRVENDMNNDISDIIISVLERRQTQEEMLIFSEWYSGSEENKLFFFQIKDIYERRKGGLYPDVKEISASWVRLRRKMEQPSPMVKQDWRNHFRRNSRVAIRAMVAAIILVLVVVGIRFLVGDSEQTWTEVRTSTRNAPQTISLPDGSTVVLNASSSLKYPDRFSRKTREVYLDGEAYFSVTRDERSVFIVHTDQQDVNVLGTQFNVQAYSSDPFAVTTLFTGKVKLATYANGKQVKNEIVMHPNQQIYFDKKKNEAFISEINPEESVTWQKGIYSFRDASLEDITRRLGQVMGITFIVSDETDRNEKYTGKFFFHQTPEEIADVLNFKGEFQIQFINDTLLLQPKN